MRDFWPDLGYGLLIFAGIALFVLISYGCYQLWQQWHWIVWLPLVIIVGVPLAAFLGHLARDLFGDRSHRH